MIYFYKACLAIQVIELWQRNRVDHADDRFFVRVFYNQEEVTLQGAEPGKLSSIL